MTSSTSGSSPRVTAVVVAHDGAAWLSRCLESVLAQGADVVVGVDTGSRDDSATLLRAALGAENVVTADRRTGFGDAVRLGLQHGADGADLGDEHWYWLLHDDCAPLPRALDALLDTAGRSSHVGVVGPKLVDWDDPTRLLEVGLTVSRTGRRSTGVEGLERDQGQHDDRTDVLAVGSAGLLVRADVWHDLDGLDPALPLLRDDVDLGWRAHLAGYRVVLAPRALVADAQAATRGLRSVDAVAGPVRRVDQVHGMRVALARCSPWAVLPLLCWMLVAGVVRSLGLLAAKSPRRSLDQLVATVLVLVTPWRWVSSRWRGRGTVRVHRRDIAQLFEPRWAALRRAVDHVGVLAARDDDEPSSGLAEPGPTSDEAEIVVVPPRLWLRRLVTHPLTLVVLALAVVSGFAWRGLLGHVLTDPDLTGGQLAHPSGRAAALWDAALGGWSGAGLGADVVASPAAVVRAGVVAALQPLAGAQAAAVAVLLLLLLAPLLAASAAYLALTGFVRSRWTRAWAGAAWATTPVVATAVSGGRLGALAALVLLPLVVAAFARALRRGQGSRSGSTTAAFAGALGAALLVSAVPAFVVPVALAALLGLLLVRGRARWRALVLLVVPLGLLGPWLRAVVDDPATLLAGPGLLAAGHAAGGGWREVVLEPAVELVRTPDGVPAWAVLATLAPLLLVGLLGLLRAGARGRSALALWTLGLLGLAGALVAPFVALARTDTGPVAPWAGTAVLLTALAAIGSAAVAAHGLQHRLSVHGFGWRQLLVAPLVALAVLTPVAGAALWVWRGVEGPLGPRTDDLPAVVVEAAHGPSGVRTLELSSAAGGPGLGYRLDGVEPGPWTRDLTVVDSAAVGTASGDPVRQVVRDLVDGPAAGGAGSAAGDAAVDQLGRLAVGFVLLRGDARSDLVTRLDATAGLARIGAPTGSALWRVGTGGIGTGGIGTGGIGTGADQVATTQERPARVRVESPAGEVLQTVPVAGAHAAVSVTLVRDGGDATRLLVLSEPASSRWRATVDGRRLPVARPQDGSWRQAFTLPPNGGHLVVGYDRSDHRWWRVGQGALAALCLLLALPVRRPREPGDDVAAPTPEPDAVDDPPEQPPVTPAVDLPELELQGQESA